MPFTGVPGIYDSQPANIILAANLQTAGVTQVASNNFIPSHSVSVQHAHGRTILQSLSDPPQTGTLATKFSRLKNFMLASNTPNSTLEHSVTLGNVTYNKTVPQTFTISHSVNVVKTLSKSVSHSLVFIQVLSSIKSIAVNQTLVLTHTIASPNVDCANDGLYTGMLGTEHSRGANIILGKGFPTRCLFKGPNNHTLALSQQVVVVKNIVRTVTHTLALVHTLTRLRVIVRPVSQTFTINQSATKQTALVRIVNHLFVPVHGLNNIPRLAHNSFTGSPYTGILGSQDARMSNLSLGVGIPETKLIHYVNLTRVRIRSASNTFALTSTVARNIVAFRSLTSTLVFNTLHGPLFLPSAQAELVKPFVILQVPQISIVLPPPEWGDTRQWNGGSISVKRSMNGTTYTYIRTDNNEILKYTFLIHRAKSLELRSFLLNHSDKYITMRNWKGERWRVRLINNPFELTSVKRAAECRENVSVTLEFEGIKLGG